MRTLTATALALLLCSPPALAAASKQENGKEEEKKTDVMSADTFTALKLRSIGPAWTSGRIGVFAVDPANPSHYFVAVASGGVWKTEDAGTSWTSVFDGEDSYSIGCVTLDPTNPNTVWVGTGENNGQRSVAWGDGVYRSNDGGKSWKNLGLKRSEHIGRIAIDPCDPRVVCVAAQGPLWAPGGDRGLYKTTDGGKTWAAVPTISENTGVSEVLMDPRNPDLPYAASYQRRRHVWTLIDGGPESAIYKSMDAGGGVCRRRARGRPSLEMATGAPARRKPHAVKEKRMGPPGKTKPPRGGRNELILPNGGRKAPGAGSARFARRARPSASHSSA